MTKLVLFLLTSSVAFAQTPPLAELIALARKANNMKYNPVALSDTQLGAVLDSAL